MRVLVTGGVRSGKSRHAEGLLAGHDRVRYVAPGPTIDDPRSDPDWAHRIRAHQARRPPGWETVESHDLATALRADYPVLVDCLGTWLSAVIDDGDWWEAGPEDVSGHVESLTGLAVAALPDDIVLVTNEVGLGIVPEHRSGRLFRDLLGVVNQRFAAACDEVHLVVAGRVLKI